MLSGLMMSLFDSGEVKGKAFRAPAPARVAWPTDTLPVGQLLQQLNLSAGDVSSGWLLDEPIYKLSIGKEKRLYSARDGRALVVDAALAQRIAIGSYRGPGQAGQAELVPRSLETRAYEGKVWRVPFSDAEQIRQEAGSRHMKTLPPSIAVWLATVAHIRHQHTDYERLLEEGYERDAARFFVLDAVNAVLTGWRATRLLDPDDDDS